MTYLRWYFELAWIFCRNMPANMLAIATCGLFSRISAMFALLLPVKIILLVGNNKVPVFFPDFLQKISHDALVYLLCGATVVFYALYAGFNKIMAFIEKRAEKQLANSLLGNNSNALTIKMLTKAYGKISGGLTDAFFLAAVTLFIAIFYPLLMMLLLFYVSLVLLGYMLFSSTSSGSMVDPTNESDEREDEDSSGSIAFWVDVGYLLSFFMIVVGMLLGIGPDILIAFICFLLLRRSSGGVKRFLRSIAYVFAQKAEVESILKSGGSDSDAEGLVSAAAETAVNDIDFVIGLLSQAFPAEVISEIWCRQYDLLDKGCDTYIVEASIDSFRKQFILRLFYRKPEKAKAEITFYQKASLCLGSGETIKDNQTVMWQLRAS